MDNKKNKIIFVEAVWYADLYELYQYKDGTFVTREEDLPPKTIEASHCFVMPADADVQETVKKYALKNQIELPFDKLMPIDFRESHPSWKELAARVGMKYENFLIKHLNVVHRVYNFSDNTEEVVY